MPSVATISLVLFAFSYQLIDVRGTLAGEPPAELVRLRELLEKKRGDALKPIDLWYEKQLENGLKQATKNGDFETATGFRDELTKFRENGKLASNEDFEKSLLASSWSWAGQPNERGVELTFQRRPTVSHIGMSGTWEITGPREVTIFDKTGERHVLEFDEAVTGYRRKSGGVVGRRWQ